MADLRQHYKDRGRLLEIMVGVHVSREMKQGLEIASQQAGVTQSEFVRRLIEARLGLLCFKPASSSEVK